MPLEELVPFIAYTVGAVAALFILKWIGGKVAAVNFPILDRVVDALTLFAAAAIVAGMSKTDLVGIIALIPQFIYNAIAEFLSDLIPGAWLGVGVITSGIALIVLFYFGKKYEKSESWLDLLWFGLVTLAAAAMFPWVEIALEFWADYVSASVWNFIMIILDHIFYKLPGYLLDNVDNG